MPNIRPVSENGKLSFFFFFFIAEQNSTVYVYTCVCVCVCAHVLRCVQLFETPQTVACHPPLSMNFSRQEHWSRLPFPTPGNLPDPGIKLTSLYFLHCQVGSLLLVPFEKLICIYVCAHMCACVCVSPSWITASSWQRDLSNSRRL